MWEVARLQPCHRPCVLPPKPTPHSWRSRTRSGGWASPNHRGIQLPFLKGLWLDSSWVCTKPDRPKSQKNLVHHVRHCERHKQCSRTTCKAGKTRLLMVTMCVAMGVIMITYQMFHYGYLKIIANKSRWYITMDHGLWGGSIPSPAVLLEFTLVLLILPLKMTKHSSGHV